ncbi:transposase [Candidatus Kaiserbacteria bacterium]|nr:transposase [Candidatus Kaiserbacteria bacterium]
MRNKKEVDRRVKILGFWKEHGTKAARDAFGVSTRTLFRWQTALAQADGRLEALDPQFTIPKGRRKRMVSPEIEALIIKQRTEHPRIGKAKLAVLLRTEGHTVSESYTGRVIADLKKRNRLPSGRKLSYYARTGTFREQPVLRRKKLRRAHKRGMELDTIVRFVGGIKRYILTAIDVERKFAFAGAYKNHSSASAADFLKKLIHVCPFLIDELQTDNGSEFAKNFELACITLGLTHFNTYPRSPKMNAFIERFNRTISEDFIMLNRLLLRDNIDAFNEKLVGWLLWYNTERPHESLGMLSPLCYIVSTLTAGECQRYWTRTVC